MKIIKNLSAYKHENLHKKLKKNIFWECLIHKRENIKSKMLLIFASRDSGGYTM